MKRRRFIRLAGTSALAAPFLSCAEAPPSRPPGLEILVLGGTNFVGPAIVERALERGHSVTLFNRGITRPYLFPEVEKLRGERSVGGGDLAALHGDRRWHAVVDVWPEQSKLVEATARLLAGRVDYGFFVSSIATYSDFSKPGLDETSAVHENDPGWYGGEKVLAEQALQLAFPERCGVARCHAILGPRDDGTAFHYWLRRLAEERRVVAPGSGLDPVQLIDVRDVAAWVVDCLEQQRTGVFNLAGPRELLSFRSFLERAREGIQGDAELVWVDAQFLRDRGIRSFEHMPLWAPLDEDAGFQQISSAKALAEGLELRPLEQTAQDAWRWYRSHFFREIGFPSGGMGISRESEEEVLAAWDARA